MCHRVVLSIGTANSLHNVAINFTQRKYMFKSICTFIKIVIALFGTQLSVRALEWCNLIPGVPSFIKC